MNIEIGATERAEEEPRGNGVALIFPGQGSQARGMGAEFFKQSPAAKAIFEKADEISGLHLSRLCFEEELQKTEVAQLAIGTVCIAAYAAAEELCPGLKDIRPVAGGGISFGELPNLVIAGVIDFETFLHLIKERGRIMEACGENKGAMISVFGLDKEAVEGICAENDVYPAIYYPGMTYVAGGLKSLENAKKIFTAKRARIRETGVEYPFHCGLMKEAGEELEKISAPFKFQDPKFPVVLGTTGESTTSGEVIKAQLPNQLTHPVNLSKIVEAMQLLGATTFLEFCPQPVLSGHLRRIDKNLRGMSIHNVESLSPLQDFLNRSRGTKS